MSDTITIPRATAQQALEALIDAANVLSAPMFADAVAALRKALEQQAEPVAWIEHEWSGSGLKKLHFDRRDPTVRDEVMNPVWTPLYTTPPQQQAEPVAAQLTPFDILVITTAYEQGVGKGHQAHGRAVEIENPYAPGECQQAWALGYDEGKEQAASKAAHGIEEPKS